MRSWSGRRCEIRYENIPEYMIREIQFIDLYLFLCYDRLYDVQGQIPFDPGTGIVLF